MAGTWRGNDYYVDGKRIAHVVPLSKRPGWSVVVEAPNAPDKYVADPSGDGAHKWAEQNALAVYEKYSKAKATDSAKRARMHRALDAVMDSRVGARDAEGFKPGDKVGTDVTPQTGVVLEVQGSGDMAKVLVRFGAPDKYGVSDVRKLYAYLLRKA